MPTREPTLAPTPVDAASVAVVLVATCDKKPTDARTAALLATLQDDLSCGNASGCEVSGYEVSYGSTSATALGVTVTTYNWHANFTLASTLAAMGYDSRSAWADAVDAELTSSGFSSDATSDMGVTYFTVTKVNAVPTARAHPTAQPTVEPSGVPVPLPSAAPSHSPQPTTLDNARLAATLTLRGTNKVNQARSEALKGAIAQTIFGVSDDWYEAAITGYSATSTYLSLSYTWAVAFEVSASLAVVNEDSVAAWAADVNVLLSSAGFTTAASAATGISLVPTAAVVLPDNRRLLPSPQPSKSSAPTAPKPTASDTVEVAVSLAITSSSKLTAARANELKETIADEIGVRKSDLKAWTYSFATSIRRVLTRRALLQSTTTYDWTVGFTVEVSLAATDAASAEAFSAEIATDLNSAAFQANVAADLGVLITAVSASSAVVGGPGGAPGSGVKAAGLAGWAIALVVVGGFLIVACGAVAAIVRVRRGSGGIARFGVGDFSRLSFFAVSSNFNKFRMEDREEPNPLGEEYPSTFSGGSIIAQHNVF
jgi:hypothetical protein